MELVGCKALRDATRGCRVVLLVATEVEAEPLLPAFREPETYVHATKKLVVGSVEEDPGWEGARRSSEDVRAVLAITGCDKANAAQALACLLVAMDPGPSLVVQVGVAGAFTSAGGGTGAGGGAAPEVGDLVFATEEVYSDTGSSSPEGWLSAGQLGLPIARVEGTESSGRFVFDPDLVNAAVEIVRQAKVARQVEGGAGSAGQPALFAGPCVTTSRITGTTSEGERARQRFDALAESMEGAAAAQICALHQVPFLEIRGISNLVVDRDRGSWQIGRAAEVAARAGLAVTSSVERLPPKGPRLDLEPHELSGA
jgi:futalosine hydrolase